MLLFRCGAMVAHSTVNRVVTGSSPVTGAKNKKGCLPLMGVVLFIFMINKKKMINRYLKSTVKYKRYSGILFLDKQTTKVKFLFSGQNATVFGKFP